jgi:hypothetical protein
MSEEVEEPTQTNQSGVFGKNNFNQDFTHRI